MENIELEVQQARTRAMMKLQGEIRMMLIQGGVTMNHSHDLASNIFHKLITSDIADEEFKKQYEEASRD